MASFEDIILKALPDENNTATRLRLKHVFSILDVSKLGEAGFQLENEESTQDTTWTKVLNGGTHSVTVQLTRSGTLCDLRLSALEASPAEALHDRERWQDSELLPREKEIVLSKEIANATDIWPPKSAKEEWTWLLNHLSFDRDAWQGPEDDTFILCGLANDYLSEHEHLALALFVAIVRHIDEITNPDVLSDLAYRCGKLGLLGEFSLTVKRILESHTEIPATGWTNIGVVLCDHLYRPLGAMECFKRAISIDSALPQPRQCVWIAGRDLILQALQDRDFDRTIAVCEEVISLGDELQADHGFYSFAGLAHESLGNLSKAKEYYLKALAMHPGCNTSTIAFKRITELHGKTREVALGDQLSHII